MLACVDVRHGVIDVRRQPFECKVELGPLVFRAEQSGGLEPAQDLRFRQAHVVKDQMTVGATSQGPGLQPRFSVPPRLLLLSTRWHHQITRAEQRVAFHIRQPDHPSSAYRGIQCTLLACPALSISPIP
jgi:hypothetical protein